MLILASSSDAIKVQCGTTGSDIEVHASWVDNVSGVLTPGRTDSPSITDTTNTTVVAGPGSGQRLVKFLSIFNKSGSVATSVVVTITDGTNTNVLINATLKISEILQLNGDGQWVHYDNFHKRIKAGYPMATRAEMEAGSSLVVAASPKLFQHHPGITKAWGKCNAAGALMSGYNIASITDTGAGLASPQISTDFSSANYCCVASCEKTSGTLTVTNLKHCNIRNATLAAGSFTIECYDATAGTAVQEDPAAYYFSCLGTLV